MEISIKITSTENISEMDLLEEANDCIANSRDHIQRLFSAGRRTFDLTGTDSVIEVKIKQEKKQAENTEPTKA
jgi:hypothetical protein